MTPTPVSPVPSQSPPALTRLACLRLLSAGGHGRVAATMRAIPVVIPVTYALTGAELTFTPSLGEGRAEAIENRVVAFETDALGADGHTAWDVHVTGVATSVLDGSVISRFRLSTDVMSGWGAGG